MAAMAERMVPKLGGHKKLFVCVIYPIEYFLFNLTYSYFMLYYNKICCDVKNIMVFYENSGWQGDGLYCVQIAGTLLVARLFLTATGFAFTTASLNPLSQVEVLGKVKGVFSSRF